MEEFIHSKIDPIADNEKAGVYKITFSTEHPKSLFILVVYLENVKQGYDHLSDLKFSKPNTL